MMHVWVFNMTTLGINLILMSTVVKLTRLSTLDTYEQGLELLLFLSNLPSRLYVFDNYSILIIFKDLSLPYYFSKKIALELNSEFPREMHFDLIALLEEFLVVVFFFPNLKSVLKLLYSLIKMNFFWAILRVDS